MCYADGVAPTNSNKHTLQLKSLINRVANRQIHLIWTKFDFMLCSLQVILMSHNRHLLGMKLMGLCALFCLLD